MQSNKVELTEQLQALRNDYARRVVEELDTLVTISERFVQDGALQYRDELRIRMHKLAGSAGTYGFAEIGQLAYILERLLCEPNAQISPEKLLCDITAMRRVWEDSWSAAGNGLELKRSVIRGYEAGDAEEATGLRILVVDDDEDHCRLLTTILQHSFHVIVACNGAEALSRYVEDKPDIVLLDIELPGRDGYQICADLAEASPREWRSVIFVSSRDRLEEKIKAFDAGGDDFIAKPIDFSEFLPRLKALTKFTLAKKQLFSQQQLAQDMAFASMAESAQYGQMANFMRKAMQCETQDALVSVFFELMNDFGLNASLRIMGRQSRCYGGPGKDCSPIEVNLFELLKDAGRLYHFGARTLVNDQHVAFLIKNMPIDDSKSYGRLKDMIALLVEALEASHLAISRKIALSTTVDNISFLLHRIANEYLAADSTTINSLQCLNGLMREMETGFHSLGLNETQENYLHGLLDKGASDAEKIIEALNTLRDDLLQINTALIRNST